MVRATLQELLRELPDRPWHQVYAEVLHINNVIMRHARNKVEQGDTLDPSELDQLIQAAGRAGLLAKGAGEAGVADRVQLDHNLLGAALVHVLGRALWGTALARSSGRSCTDASTPSCAPSTRRATCADGYLVLDPQQDAVVPNELPAPAAVVPDAVLGG